MTLNYFMLKFDFGDNIKRFSTNLASLIKALCFLIIYLYLIQFGDECLNYSTHIIRSLA